MSATIAQKNASAMGRFFECGDLFNGTRTTNDKKLTSTFKMTDNNVVIDALETASNVEQKDLGSGVLPMDYDKEVQQKELKQSQHVHTVLTRTISQPHSHPHPLSVQTQCQLLTLSSSSFTTVEHQLISQQKDQQEHVSSLVTIIENLGGMNLHRKLERTQSEPLPQQPRYKTELCRPFEEAGECKYGEKCQFAHGNHELRNLQRHPKYKTEYCRTFHSVGFCPYGPRCHFVHNADEAQQQQQQQQQKSQGSVNGTATSNAVMPAVGTSLKDGTISGLNKQHHNNNQLTTMPTHQQIAAGVAVSQYFLPLSPPLSMSTGSDRESPTGSLTLSPTNSMTNFSFTDQGSPINTLYHSAVASAAANNCAFSYGSATPPESPNTPISPINTPPPSQTQTPSSTAGSASASSSLTATITAPTTGSTKNLNLQFFGIGVGNLQKPSVATPPRGIYFDAHNVTKDNISKGKPILQKSVSTPNAALQKYNNNHQEQNNAIALMAMETAPRLPVFNRLSSTVENYKTNLAL